MADPAAPAAVGISLRGLSIRAGGRTLLDGASAEIPAGGTTLIVGPSGAGKSLLLRVIAGLLRDGDGDIEVSGEAFLVRGGERLPPAPGRAGIVFQGFALFDELSAAGNVLFGLDHGRRRRAALAPGGAPPRRAAARALLEELGVPADLPVDVLSGGQKQRLAIARVLAYDPDVLIFDEPTSGLDPVNARRIAQRIAKLQTEAGKTTVIVTHDTRHLAEIADRILLVDPGARALREATAADLDALEAAPTAPPPPISAARRAAVRSGDALAAAWAAAAALAAAALAILPRWPSARWGLRYLAHYARLASAPSALAYFAAAGTIAGFVSTHFTFKFLPFKAYTEPLLTEELLHGLGFSLYRIIIPVLLTVLLAARTGAAITADVGSRVHGRQIEALRSFGAAPGPYLLTGIVLALLVTTPILIGAGFLAARLTSILVFSYNYPQHAALFWDAHFHHDLRDPSRVLWLGTGWVLAKISACAFATAAISYYLGLRPKRSGVDVSRAITHAIIWATLAVLVIHFGFVFLEF